MNLVDSVERAGIGAAGGGLAGCLLGMLDIAPVFGVTTEVLLIIGLIGGGVVGALGRQRWMLGVAALPLITYAFITNTPTMGHVAKRWVRADTIPPGQDAIVVLSGSILADSALNTAGSERLLTGIALYRSGVAPRL